MSGWEQKKSLIKAEQAILHHTGLLITNELLLQNIFIENYAKNGKQTSYGDFIIFYIHLILLDNLRHPSS